MYIHSSPSIAMCLLGMTAWVVFLVATHAVCSEKSMEVVYKWQLIDFTFPDEASRNEAIENGYFEPGNAVVIDIDVTQDGRKIVALPAFYSGSNASLATISDQQQADGSFLMAPYPDWSWHQYEDCDSIVSAFRIYVDSCNRLWVIDSGIVHFMTSPRRVCPPQLLVFDLTTNTLIRRHQYPANTLDANNLLCTVVVETDPESCEDAFAYVADVYGFALHVYTLLDDRSWRVSGNLFYPYPLSGHFIVDGYEYDRMGGVIGLALDRPQSDGDRILYFHSMASHRDSWVYTSLLKNESNFPGLRTNLLQRQFHMLEGHRQSQAVPMAMDSHGILFFNLVSSNSLNCWNSQMPFGGSNIVELYRDDEALQFATGLKVIPFCDNSSEEEVWLLTCRFQRMANYTFNRSDINFRVVKGQISELVEGTLCQVNSTQDEN